MDMHLAQTMHIMIGQLQTSSHQLYIEVGKCACTPLYEWICQLRHHGMQSEQHSAWHCTIFYEIRWRYHCVFNQGFHPLTQVMEYEDNQRCLGPYLLELKRRNEKLLDPIQPHKLINKEQSQFSLALALLSCYKPIKGYTSEVPTRILQKSHSR